jgi:hypothetical protein
LDCYVKASKNVNYYELPALAQQVVYYAFQAEIEVKKIVDNLFYDSNINTEHQLPHPNNSSFPNRYDEYKAKYVELLQQFIE